MHRSTAGRLLYGLAVLCLASWAMADTQTDYDMLFGAEARRVEATRATEDDAAFAGRLLAASGNLKDSPPLQKLVLDKAYQYGIRNAAGLEASRQALDQMARSGAISPDELDSRNLELAELQFTLSSGQAKVRAGHLYVEQLVKRADAQSVREEVAEVRKLLDAALPVAQYVRSPRTAEIIAKRRLEGRRAELLGRFKSDPKDVSARKELLLHYLLDRNDPEKAARLVRADLDETLRTYVPLACRPPKSLPEGVCLELGGWYETLSQAASPEGKPVALSRAVDCYRQYLALHTLKDAPGLKVRLTVENIRQSLGERYVAPPVAAAHVSSDSTGDDPAKTLTLDLGKGVTMKLALIPAGKFLMGSPDNEKDRQSQEGPQHEVTITKPFYMGVYEVTQEQYEAVMGTNAGKPAGSTDFRLPTTFRKTVAQVYVR